MYATTGRAGTDLRGQIELPPRTGGRRPPPLPRRHAPEPLAPRPDEAVRAQTRDERIRSLMPLVDAIARRIARRLPRHVEHEELVQNGMIGLIEAVDRFDPSMGVPLAAFARSRVRGAIVDGLRRADWVPRSVRREATWLDEAAATLRQRLGREASEVELARAMQLEPAAVGRLRARADVGAPLSLDAPADEEGAARLVERLAGESVDPERALEHHQRHREILGAVHRLPERQRAALLLYYADGLTLREIGARLGVCESRVCQINRAGLASIRAELQAVAA